MNMIRKSALSAAVSIPIALVLTTALSSPAIAEGEDNWLLLSAGERVSVLAPTSGNATSSHNGTEWYYTPGLSMGFAPLGAGILQESADIAGLADETAQGRLSWHLQATSMSGGYRAGELTGLNSSTDVYRAVYEADTLPAYYPSGPQRNVPFESLVGWTLCWSDTYAGTVELETLWAQCDGAYLLFAGGPGADPAAEPEPEPAPAPEPELAETGATDTVLPASLAALLLAAGAIVLRRAHRTRRA